MNMDDAAIERLIDARIDHLTSQYEASSLSQKSNNINNSQKNTMNDGRNASATTDTNATDDDAGAGPRPELPPAMVVSRSRTTDEILADLNKSPLFMTELEENDDTAALQALAYEGTPLENAEGFRERGNECFKMRGYKDAQEFYGKGILILAAEERKRLRKAAGEKEKEEDGHGDEDEDEDDDDDDDEVQQEKKVLEAMYSNRAACHLELRNYRSCWLDCAAALRLNPRNVKAYYRSARALLAVDRIPEADDACARGLALDGDNAALRRAAGDILSRAQFLDSKARQERERAARKEMRGVLLKAALAARGIEMLETDDPPDMEDARVRLAPDEDDPASELVVPTMLLYPLRMESDFIKAFGETQTLEDHLGYVLPPPWDAPGGTAGTGGGSAAGGATCAYTMEGVTCFVETKEGGLMKMGKRVSLLKVLSGGRVVLVDQVMRIFVLPVDEADAWAREFKEKRKAERAGR